MILTLSKIVLLSVIILCAFWNWDSTNMTPFFLPEFGLKGTLLSASIIFYGYLGFDVITTISEEAKNPKKDVPAAVAVCCALHQRYADAAKELQGMLAKVLTGRIQGAHSLSLSSGS